MDMHRGHYLGISRFSSFHDSSFMGNKDQNELADIIDECERFLIDKKGLGSQRVLQNGGFPMLRKHARGYNCSGTWLDRPKFFSEAFWLALCGVGTGYSVLPDFVSELPSLKTPKSKTRTFVIPDTIEGWADALDALVSSYFFGEKTVNFDFSKIRPTGSPISNMTGRSPDVKHLKNSLEQVRQHLNDCLIGMHDVPLNAFDKKFTDRGKLRPFDAHRIPMMMAEAVMSGGIRRSASIVFFHQDDLTMMNCKTGDWFKERSYLSYANNSCALDRNTVDDSVIDTIVTKAMEWGEPAPFLMNSDKFIYNPCGEVGFYPVSPVDGKTGWGFCNLGTINIPACDNIKDLTHAAEMVSKICTLQAGYTKFGYLTKASEEIARHEALIGVSMTGIMEKPKLVFSLGNMLKASHKVKLTNTKMAALIDINVAARTTCIKPEGTGSPVLGTSACGIHASHSKKYLRRMIMDVKDPIVKHFEKHAPNNIEYDIHDKGKARLVFAIETPDSALVKDDLSMRQQIKKVAFLKKWWIDQGKREDRCLHKDLENNVSNTILVAKDEVKDVAREIIKNKNSLAGVSFTSDGFDLFGHDTPNAKVEVDPDPDMYTGQTAFPWTREKRCDDEARRYLATKWEKCAKTKDIDLTEMIDDALMVKVGSDSACSGGSCEIL